MSAARRELFADDHFARVRSDEELAELVSDVAKDDPAPYRALLRKLLGAAVADDEGAARDLWLRIIEHRRAMREALLRPVHVRVAALDLLFTDGQSGKLRPLALTRQLATSVADELASASPAGLMTREHFVVVLEHELRRKRRATGRVALIELFALRTSSGARAAGNGAELARAFADACRAAAPPGAVFARLGKAEFAAYLPGATEQSASATLTRAQRSFAEAVGAALGGVSFGLAAVDDQATLASLLTAADTALTKHKRAQAVTRQRAGSLPTPVAAVLHASNNVRSFVNVHGRLAKRGYLSIPAADAATATTLYRLIRPVAVLADFMFPPAGGEALLFELGIPGGARSAAVVAALRWPDF